SWLSPSGLPDSYPAWTGSERAAWGWAALQEAKPVSSRSPPLGRTASIPRCGLEPARHGLSSTCLADNRAADLQSLRTSLHTPGTGPVSGSFRSSWRLSALELEKDLSQLLQSAMHPGLDGSDLATHELRDLLVLEVLEAAQDQHFPLFFRHAHQRPLEQRCFLRLLCRIRRQDGRRELRLPARLRAAPAQLIHPGIARDLVHPGPKRSICPVGLAVFQNAQEHFLHQVFTGRALAGQLQIEVE